MKHFIFTTTIFVISYFAMKVAWSCEKTWSKAGFKDHSPFYIQYTIVRFAYLSCWFIYLLVQYLIPYYIKL